MEYSPAIQRMKEYHESKGGEFFTIKQKGIATEIYPYNYGRYIIDKRTRISTGETLYHVYQFELPSGKFTITEGVNFETLLDAVNCAMKFKADRNEDSLWPYGGKDGF
jgi:hypothetical protein